MGGLQPVLGTKALTPHQSFRETPTGQTFLSAPESHGTGPAEAPADPRPCPGMQLQVCREPVTGETLWRGAAAQDSWEKMRPQSPAQKLRPRRKMNFAKELLVALEAAVTPGAGG